MGWGGDAKFANPFIIFYSVIMIISSATFVCYRFYCTLDFEYTSQQ